jgi:hypothetical protein
MGPHVSELSRIPSPLTSSRPAQAAVSELEPTTRNAVTSAEPAARVCARYARSNNRAPRARLAEDLRAVSDRRKLRTAAYFRIST